MLIDFNSRKGIGRFNMSWEITHCEISASELLSGTSAFSIHTHYVNHTGFDVSIALRNGLKLRLPNEVNYGKAGFKVRTDIYCDSKTFDSLYRYLMSEEQFPKQELAAIKQYLDTRMSNEQMNMYRGGHLISLWYTLPAEKLKLVRVSECYLPDVDLVISMSKDLGAIHHPYSEAGAMDRVAKDFGKQEPGTHLGYLVVDNSGLNDHLYLRVGSKIYKVKGQCHLDKREGVYITDSGTGDINYISFDENLAEWGLFRTYAEATELGNKLLEETLKKEYAEKEAELVARKMELETAALKQKMEFEQSKLAIKKEEAYLERLHEERRREIELEELRRKNFEAERKAARDDYYDSRSAARKDSSEALKTIPVLLAGIGGVFTIFKTLGVL